MRRSNWFFLILISAVFLYGCPSSDPDVYEVSGVVIDGDEEGIEGVTISFGGGESAVETDSAGEWSKADLEGEVIITPDKDGWSFQPAEIAVSGARDDITFVGTEVAEADQYTIELFAEPAEGGTVDGGGIFDEGDEITVTAQASEGFEFLHWMEDDAEVSAEPAYTFTVEADRELVAHFEGEGVSQYTIELSAEPVEGGTVDGGGVFDEGDEITVTAEANEGFEFLYWMEDADQASYEAAYTFTVEGDRELIAHFEAAIVPEYTIEVSAEPAEGGTVEGGGVFDEGEEITVTAEANEDFELLYWMEDGDEVSYEASYTFTVESDRELVAHFGEEVLFETDVTITGGATFGERFEGSQTAGNLIADAMRDAAGADVALFPSVNMEHGVLIEPGTFTRADLLALYAGHIATNMVVFADILVADLNDLLLERSRAYDNVNDQISGITYDILLHDDESGDDAGTVRRVLLYDLEGEPLSPDDIVTTAFCSYAFENHYGVEGLVDNEEETDETQASLLLDYVAAFSEPIPESLEDPRITIDVDPEQDEPEEALGETEVALTGGSFSDRFAGSTTAANLIADAIRSHTGADFGTINSTVVRPDQAIEPGPFTEEELLDIYVSHIANNHAVVADITGAELEDFLLVRSQEYDNVDIQVSGFSYDIHLDADGNAIEVDVRDGDGDPLEADGVYSITFNSYNYDTSYELDDVVENISETEAKEEEMLLDYVAAFDEPIPASLADDRVTIIPAD